MARYQKFKDADVRYVYDTQTEEIFKATGPGETDYVKTILNIQMLSKFVPTLRDDGEFDDFPGTVIDT